MGIDHRGECGKCCFPLGDLVQVRIAQTKGRLGEKFAT